MFSYVASAGKGQNAGIKIGEQILEINGTITKDLVHVAAQKLIKNTGDALTLTLEKTGTSSSISTASARGNEFDLH